jgi:hypothetical protein
MVPAADEVPVINGLTHWVNDICGTTMDIAATLGATALRDTIGGGFMIHCSFH